MRPLVLALHALAIVSGAIAIAGQRAYAVAAVVFEALALLTGYVEGKAATKALGDLKDRVLPRRLSDNDKHWLKSCIKGLEVPPLLFFEYERDDQESALYANEIQAAYTEGLKEAKFTAGAGGSWTLPRPTGTPMILGLTMVVLDKENPPAVAKGVLDAFLNAGIAIGLESRRGLPPDRFIISTGKKPI